MDRPTLFSVVGSHRPAKTWHCESYTDIYGTFVIEELNEACTNLLLAQDPQSIPWINGLDLLVSNMINNLPYMLALLMEIQEIPDLPPKMRKRISLLLKRIDDIPLMPLETETKKRKKNGKSNSRSKVLLLGELPIETEL